MNERGIKIMPPHYFSARDGNETSIPEAYRSKDYNAPGFKINSERNNGEADT